MEISSLLRTAGLRNTRAREKILNILFETGHPVSHQDLDNRQELQGIDRVTIYRTLESLRRAGLARRIRGLDGVWRFCANPIESFGCPGNHPHFLCLSCGRMTCLVDQVLPWVNVPEGAQVRGKQLIVYGLCPECALAEKRKNAGKAGVS